MTDATELWTAVVADYDSEGLIGLTNPRNPAATSVGTSVGQAAAQAVINLWPAYAEVAYDSTDNLHVEVGEMAVIAMLFRRGGTSAKIAKIEWEEIFGDDGLLGKVRRTGSRARQGPTTNSGVRQKPETLDGQRVRGWADPESMPGGRTYLPRRTIAGND